ncbi:MAG TPA: DUF4337 domain-containing protein [Terracidiphilus sp.]|nr:DUF4337 domain-containing protein [Terracidiphilus sp.]
MEANEAQELKEQQEHGGESSLRPVAFTMSVVAVLVAITTVLGHRTHTEAVLDQNKATDQWNEYQAHKIRSNDTALAYDLLSVVTVADKEAAQKIAKAYADHQAKWADELKDDKEKAEALETKVEEAEARANRFDLGEALLEIGLVISSVTLLTRTKMYWYFGIVFSLLGIASAASVLLLK